MRPCAAGLEGVAHPTDARLHILADFADKSYKRRDRAGAALDGLRRAKRYDSASRIRRSARNRAAPPC